MEGREEEGVTVLGSDAPSEYQLSRRTDALTSPPPATNAMVVATVPVKKKRGRPRKYGPDSSMPLSPQPISTAAPASVIDFTSEKRPKIKPFSHKSKYDSDSIGDWVACSVGANFTPHIITVNTGEDVTMKIISFSQQGPRAICILSANGVISSVTLRQPDSSGGTLTYEGRFEILSLSGSFMPTETSGNKSRSGGMSVSLASPDGRVVGGGVGGLVAASPVQVVVGSFLAGSQHEQKQKKPKHDTFTMTTTISAAPTSTSEVKATFTSTSFHTGSWPPMTIESSKPADMNVPLQAS